MVFTVVKAGCIALLDTVGFPLSVKYLTMSNIPVSLSTVSMQFYISAYDNAPDVDPFWGLFAFGTG